MNKYVVSIPIAGHISIEVEAPNPKAAKDAAWKKIDEGAAHEPDADVHWEFFDSITKGNVCHAPLNEICVDKVRD